MSGKREQGKRKCEYSKTLTTIVLMVFSLLAWGFVIFVCAEMHIQGDLSPVADLGPPIVGIPAAIVALYMWRARAKSKTDLEWEQTKQLTKLKEKYPEAFTLGTEETTIDDEGGNG
jgi:hypothetical protein